MAGRSRLGSTDLAQSPQSLREIASEARTAEGFALMRRIWVYLKVSTIATLVEILKSFVAPMHRRGQHRQGDSIDDAAEDLKRAKRLTDTGVTKNEIEHASRKVDEDEEKK